MLHAKSKFTTKSGNHVKENPKNYQMSTCEILNF